MLTDSYKRRINYLRLSVTDRCNLRCRYCLPESGVQKIPHEDILSYEEILVILKAAASLGMDKVRLTGGEPLVRRGLTDFIRKITGIDGLSDIRLTTNGVVLAEMVDELVKNGVRRVNVSLDSLKPETFKQITGRDYFSRVWSGLEKAVESELERVKVNCVLIRGVNDGEIEDFIRMSDEMNIDVRFIEFMPIGRQELWNMDRVITAEEIKKRIAHLGKLTPVLTDAKDGPARVFRFENSNARIGFISAITEHFCDNCNRLRITADGKLRLCLLHGDEIDIKTQVRRGASEEELRSVFIEAVRRKPGGHDLDKKKDSDDQRSMNLIGG